MSAITTRIKKLRGLKDITQDVMAERLNLSSKAYQKIENGVTKLDIDRLNDIAKIPEVSVVDLLSADEGVYVHQVSNNNQVGFSGKDIIFAFIQKADPSIWDLMRLLVPNKTKIKFDSLAFISTKNQFHLDSIYSLQIFCCF